MVHCAANGCINRDTDHKPGVTFHGFPKDKAKRREWADAINRKDWEPNDWSRICSVHFSEEHIDRTLVPVRLKDNAVPSLFHQFTDRSPTTKRKRKSTNPRRLINENLYDVPSNDYNEFSDPECTRTKKLHTVIETVQDNKENAD